MGADYDFKKDVQPAYGKQQVSIASYASYEPAQGQGPELKAFIKS